MYEAGVALYQKHTNSLITMTCYSSEKRNGWLATIQIGTISAFSKNIYIAQIWSHAQVLTTDQLLDHDW